MGTFDEIVENKETLQSKFSLYHLNEIIIAS